VQRIKRPACAGLHVSGSPGRARTADLVINSHPLYRLSYRGREARMVKTATFRVNFY